MNDDELKAHFDALRSADRRGAPGLEATLTRRRPRPLVWAMVPAVAIAAAVALFVLTRGSPGREIRAVDVGLREPEPLAFLLAPVVSPEDSR